MNLQRIILSENSQSQFHTVSFHLYKILEMTKLWKWRTDEWLSGAKEEVMVGGEWVWL